MSSPEERLRARIGRHGPIPFAEFMEEALYGEGGYYATEQPRIGPRGDFVTGSSFSPLFGAATARLIERLGEELAGGADLLEAGYGDGSHMKAVLAALPEDGTGRRWAWDRVARPVPPGAEGIADLSEVHRRPIRGLVFSYELFDALPFHRLRRTVEGWEEIQVGLEGEEFEWVPEAISSPEISSLLRSYSELAEPGQWVDLSPGWRPLYRQLADCLEAGLMVTCDYGFERYRLLDRRVRRHGTLACHRHHTVHRNPFVDVGRQDITAHVDFTALIEEGEAAGLETIALVSQAEWLGACGLFEGLAEADQVTRLEAAQLLDPEGMGTAIRILVQRRAIVGEGLFELPLGGSEM